MFIKAILTIVVLFFVPARALAVSSYAPANYYPIEDNVQEGDIITFIDGRYTLSAAPYDQYVVGIITANPAITQQITGPRPYFPVINTGEGYILVSTSNGPIKKGDYITSSSTPGVGQKADNEKGTTLGVAQEDFDPKDKNVIGKIPISLNVHNLAGGENKQSVAFPTSINQPKAQQNPTKDAFAVVVVAMSLIFSFIMMSKTLSRGIDALGRNPAAGRQIRFSIALNVFVALMILAVGFTTSSLVLRS